MVNNGQSSCVIDAWSLTHQKKTCVFEIIGFPPKCCQSVKVLVLNQYILSPTPGMLRPYQLWTSPSNKHRDTAKLLLGNTTGPDSRFSGVIPDPCFRHTHQMEISQNLRTPSTSLMKWHMRLCSNSGIRNSDWQVNTLVIKPRGTQPIWISAE